MSFHRWTIAIVLTLLLGACSTTPPKRDPYTGPDQVSAVTQQMMMGTWSTRILNPIEGEPTGQVSQITLNPDGSATGQVLVKLDVPTTMDMTGSWRVEGSDLITAVSSLKGDGVAGFGAKIAQMMIGGKESRINVYQAASDRLVLVSEETGQAQEWSRVR